MNMQDCLSYLDSLRVFGNKPGLDSMNRLLENLENPHRGLKCIHVAGTNGKGSVVTILSEILSRNGLNAGKYISPHLMRVNERISINNIEIDDETFCNLVDRVAAAAHTDITYFEFITAVAFLYFNMNCTDVVVLETGMGGRFDATNVIESPLVSVITSISLDHTNVLGETLDKIACEKCGIIKNYCPTIFYPMQSKDVYDIILDRCKEKKSPVFTPDIRDLEILQVSKENSKFIYKYENYCLSLIGEHQIYNFITAIEVINLLANNGFAVQPATITSAAESMQFKGRMHMVSPDPLVYIDGAHNSGSIDMLCKNIGNMFKDKRIITIISMVNDKNYEYCVKEVSKVSQFVITTSSQTHRSVNPYVLFNIAEKYCTNTEACRTIADSINRAIDIYDNQSVIIVTGSLYNVNDVQKIFNPTSLNDKI